MSHTAVAVAKASYERCQEIPHFFEAFYERFFERCPAARPMFDRTDFTRQHKLLQHAIGLLLAYDQHPAAGPNLLSRVAERHGRDDLKVNPAHFDDFLDSLIQTAAAFDPQFTAETEMAWREALAKGVAYMKSKG
ncbi:MAG TPA: globin domain-containing protein [Gemmatimonadales bacterium]|nr:globin domain-containing protein [Gemmatimonadales bacterium]